MAGAQRVEAEADEAEEAAEDGGSSKKKKKAKQQRGGGGGGGFRLDPSLLEGDFDPEAWDRQMAAVFNDAYYVGGVVMGLPLMIRTTWVGRACLAL